MRSKSRAAFPIFDYFYWRKKTGLPWKRAALALWTFACDTACVFVACFVGVCAGTAVRGFVTPYFSPSGGGAAGVLTF